MANNSFHNWSPAEFADEYGEVKERIKDLEKRQEELREAMIKRRRRYFKGTTFEVTVSKDVRRRLDQKALEDKMGKDFVNRFKKPSDVTTLTYRRIASEAA